MTDWLKKTENGETRKVEFKAELPHGGQLAKTAVAFANGAGGDILLVHSQELRVGCMLPWTGVARNSVSSSRTRRTLHRHRETEFRATGTGTVKIFTECADNQPVFKETGGFIKVTFPRPTKAKKQDGGVNFSTNDIQRQILILLKKQHGLWSNAISKHLPCAQATTERHLKKLWEQGLITFKGSPKTGGYHILKP